ncbi:COG complex component [Crassisporium funariophilum]|nr:COG complex component [Crassisporium funariophilum]
MPLSPRNEDLSFRDPYQLERLAEELASRELVSPQHFDSRYQSDDPVNHDLPEHIPLSHDDNYLTAEVFNVEEFLLARSYTSLPDLRAELRQYLTELKEELVKLINDDYAAFISLSTDLRDEGARLVRIKFPLGNLKVKVLESKRELQDIQNVIHGKLTKRAVLREEKALLHLLLKISESMTRLESLLSIASPDQGEKNSMELGSSNFSMYPSHSEDNTDEKFRGSRAKHLGRVAAEYTQLLYHVRKARAENCVFVDEVQWRVDRVQSTLSSDLDQLFAQTVILLTDPKGENKGTELERTKWTTDLTECFRTYDILGLWRDAEDVIRQEVVRAFVKKTIYPGALAAPHSPIVPHTPFHTSDPGLMTPANSNQQIPYTPFTAFVPKQSMYKTSGSAQDLSQAYLLDDSDDPLARLYNQLLRFVERDITRMMDVAEKVTMKPIPDQRIPPSPMSEVNREGDSRGFEIMANVIWDEFGRSIMDEIGGVVFAAGRPNDFRKHYETTQAFIRSLELLAPSLQAVEEMRRHPIYLAFERRWQLPVYFQLRWKEIAGTLEEVLAADRLEPISLKNRGSFATTQAAATWIAISACWSSEIFIPELCHRFWRLTLQILSRYRVWLDGWMAAISSPSKLTTNAPQDKTGTQNIPRSSTPVSAPEITSAENDAAEDALLRQYSAATIDIKLLETNTTTLWRQTISMMMSDTSDTQDLQAEGAIREILSQIVSFIAPLSNKIVAILSRRCCDALLPVRSIPSQYRAMSNKRNPLEPSYFVSSILQPVKKFFAIGVAEGPGYLLKESFIKSYSTEVFNNVTQRYISYLTAMKKTEESLKRLKKGKKSPYSLFGNMTSPSDEGRDEERIRNQMVLDAEAFGRDAQSLQVDVETNQSFLILKEMVYASDGD